MNIPIIYEDQWLVILNKPSGLLTIPTPKNESRTLTSILNDDIKEKGLGYRLHPCHRLDRATSGLIIYAKGKSSQKQVMDLFRQKKIKKTYIAFVQGEMPKSGGVINFPVEGKPAQTNYRVIEKRQDYSIVEAAPQTGRTNQIRIHFKGLGCPILGEDVYAFRRDFKIKAKRLCLHAQTLEFKHPVTQKGLCLDAPLPEELKKFLESHK